MKKGVLLLVLLLSLSVAAQVPHYYELELQYHEGEISLQDLQVKPLLAVEETSGAYAAEVVSVDNDILDITFFGFSTFVLFDAVNPETGEVDRGGLAELNQTEMVVYVPYFDNAKEINIYDGDLDLKLSVPVASFAQEVAREKVIREEELLEEREFIRVEEPPKRIVRPMIVGSAAAIIFLIVIFILMHIRRKRPSAQQNLPRI